MRIAIHHRENSFSDYWIAYCKDNQIDYIIVNAFESNIIEQVRHCDIFIWHYSHAIYEDLNTAQKILFSLEHANVKVYPDMKTCWHFDDKIAQKYLLEATNSPLVPSHVFYSKQKANIWIKSADFPIVFKLKGGAGGSNVKLIKSHRSASKLVKRAFSKGFPQLDRLGNLKDSYTSYREGTAPLNRVSSALLRLVIPTKFSKLQPAERQYVYFQKYIPSNAFDIRVVVVGGEKAVAERRLVRKNDFRASGSSLFEYDGIDTVIIEESFRVANLLKLQTVAFDFIYDQNGKPLIIELSYAFGMEGISKAPGYWDQNLNWHNGEIKIQEWLMNYLIKGTTA